MRQGDTEHSVNPELFEIMCAILSSGAVVTLIVGLINYYGSDSSVSPLPWHHLWALRLIEIAPACFLFAIPVYYSLSRYAMVWSWMPFQRKGIIWKRLPYVLWILISVIWSSSFLFLFILYLVKAFDPVFTSLWKILQSLVVVCYLADGTAEDRLKKIWKGS
jgi:hypothetical protein